MADQQGFSDPAEISHVIGGSGTFSLHGVSGDIEIRGTDGDEALVVARGNRGNGELPLIVRRSEGGLHVEVDHKGFDPVGRGHASTIDFEVQVPRAARVEINSVSSDVVAHDLCGEQSFRTVSGDLMINGQGGRVSLTTVSGDAGLKSNETIAAELTTTSGDVEVDAPLLTSLQVRTVSGDANIRAGFVAGPIHSVESVSGDVSLVALSGLTVEVKRGLDIASRVGRQLVAGDGSARLRFRTLSGDLDLSGAGTSLPTSETAPAEQPQGDLDSEDSLEVLRALERGDIDVEEATRRLEGAASRG